MSETQDYYAVLGVAPRATGEELNIAFSRQVRRFPETARDPNTNPAFRRLVIAYKMLSDPERRAVYDQQMATHTITGFQALRVQLLASQTTLPALNEDQVLYLLLDISADPSMLSQEAPLNLCLVIDRSTSMSESRMSQVKSAAQLLVDQLGPSDMLSLVTFSDQAEVVVPSSPVQNKALLKSRISQIATGGATEILSGLRLGLEELRRGRGLSQVSHLILLTDGHTYGDEEPSIQLAKKAAADGIGFSALGIGHEWNDAFLDGLVTPSGGSSAYLEFPQQVVAHLEQRIKSLSRAFAQNMQLQIELPPAITLRSIHKLSPFPSPLPDSKRGIPLGTMQHNVPLSSLIELVVAPHPPDVAALIGVDLTADIIPTCMRGKHFFCHLEIDFAVTPPQKPPLPAVVRAVNKLSLYQINEQAWEEAERGESDAAARRMEKLGSRLLSQGENQLAETAFSEAVTISRTGHLSAGGRKKLKYGTRALVGHYDHMS